MTASSGIITCRDCDGKGAHWNGQGRGGCDPDSWDIPCDTCEGEGFFPCAACGNVVQVDGYDCFACEVAGYLPADAQLTGAQIANLTIAIETALRNAALVQVTA